MGLGLYTRAERSAKGNNGHTPSPIRQAELLAVFRSVIASTPLAPFWGEGARGDGREGFVIYLYPAEEPVFVEVQEEHIVVNAKTSSAGPGYHAFLVSALGDLETRLGLRWQWSGSCDERPDETGYAASRDFPCLQREMASFLKGLYSRFLQVLAAGYTNVRLAMPVEFDAEGGANEVLTPLGPLSSEEIAAKAELSGKALEEAACSHFPWWEEGFGASFYRGLVLNAMWMNISWAAPESERERQEMQSALNWCEKAAQLDPSLPLPAEAIEELRLLAASHEPSHLPAGTGIGYRRRFMRRKTIGGWSVSVPGALNETMDDDGKTVCFWNSEVEVRGSSLTAKRREDAPPVPATDARKPPIRTEFSGTKSGDGYMLTAIAEHVPGDDTVNAGIFTVWMEDESLRPLAERVAASIRYEPPQSR